MAGNNHGGEAIVNGALVIALYRGLARRPQRLHEELLHFPHTITFAYSEARDRRRLTFGFYSRRRAARRRLPPARYRKINARLRWICLLAMAKSTISARPFGPSGTIGSRTGCAIGSSRLSSHPDFTASAAKIGALATSRPPILPRARKAYAEPAIDGSHRLAQTEDEAANRSATVQAKGPAYKMSWMGHRGAGLAAY